MSITGHQTEQTVRVNAKKAEQKRLAKSAIRKLAHRKANGERGKLALGSGNCAMACGSVFAIRAEI